MVWVISLILMYQNAHGLLIQNSKIAILRVLKALKADFGTFLPCKIAIFHQNQR